MRPCPASPTRRQSTHHSLPEDRSCDCCWLIPFIGLLWVPFYNHELPALFGFPFFYWYQLVWVPVTAFLIWIVFKSERKRGVK